MAAAAVLLAAPAPAGADVSNVTVEHGSPSAAGGARTQYVVGFTATGGLSGAGTMTVTFPSGTGFTGYAGADVFDATTNQAVGSCFGPSGGASQCYLFSGEVINAGDRVRITFNGITNPAEGSYTLTVSTTADPNPVASGSYAVDLANQLSGVSVDHASPSPAEGARTQYVVRFTASATGGLSPAGNSRIIVSYPGGTTFTGYGGAEVFNVTTDQAVGSCFGPSGGASECYLFSGEVINAGDEVRVTLNGITNPSTAGDYNLDVSTTSDITPVNGSYFVAADNLLSGVTVLHGSPSAAAGARTQYVVGFTASATGGLSPAGNSRIIVSYPGGTTFTGYGGAEVFNVTTDQVVGSCFGPSGGASECYLFSGEVINAGDEVRVTLNGITNPSAGPHTLSVSTTSDTTAVSSSSYGVVGANQLSGVTAVNGSPSAAAGARTQYVVGFTASATGGLSPAANSRITVSYPSGTTFTGYAGAEVFNVTTDQVVGSCFGPSGLASECYLFSGEVVNAGDQVRVTLNGITNPTAGSRNLDVSTTSDTTPVTSGSYSVVAANQLTSVSLTLDSPVAGSTTRWIVGFNASATGGLSSAANSRITVRYPSGTTFAGYAGAEVFDVTTNQAVGSCFGPSGGASECYLFSGEVVNGGDSVRVSLNGITNPSNTGENTVDVSTTSDTTPVTSSGSVTTQPPPDTTPPNAAITGGPTGTTTVSSPTFEFNSNEVGSTFQCSVDGGPFVDCSSPFTTPLLPAGPHTFAVRARDAAGNVGPATTVSFTVAAQTLEDLPDPTIGEEVNIGPVGDGPVLIGIADGTPTAGARASQKGITFVPLTEARQVPVGSFLDTKKGTVALESARDRLGTRQRGTFLNGLFQVRQSRKLSAKGRTDLILKGGNFSRCRTVGKGKPTAALSRRQIRRLRANARGRFRTGGRNSSATVRGTVWDIADRCDGTLTKVRRGSVVVRDFRRKRNIVVRAGKSYLARAPG